MTTNQNAVPIQYLLTLPLRMAAEFEELEGIGRLRLAVAASG